PVLYFLHVELPHGPWSYFPSGTEYNYGKWKSPLAKEETLQGWGNDKSVSDRAFQRYMLQLIYTDRLLGQLVDRLQEQRIWDPSVFIVTADHGISFDPGDSHRPVTKSNYVDVLSVPLFIKFPGQREGRIDDRKAETIDIVPTLAAVLQSDTQWKWDGESLLRPPKRSSQRAVRWSFASSEFLSLPSFSYRDSKILKLKQELFGQYTGEEAIYRFGPHPEVHGLSTAEIPHLQQDSLSAEIYNRQWFDNVDLSRKFMPALVTGKIHKPADLTGSMNLAVAINGTVRGSVRTFRLDDRMEGFALLVPESSFRQGNNDVEVFLVSKGNLLEIKTGWVQ
ncbi:MAG TPA: sulfatase-like hydrolase/transferase, partial [Acidobacteriota bacterium]